jgi:S-adenosylmethionine:tRNA ribosyltransferase-isomerase
MLTVTKLFMRKKKELRSSTAGPLLETFAKRLEIKGIKFAEVTLHVGLELLIQLVEDLSKHKMDSEELKLLKKL